MASPSALARGRIQTLKGQSLPARGVPCSSCRHHGDPRPQGPLGVAEQSQSCPVSCEISHPGPSLVLPLQSSEAGPGPWEGAWTPTW